MKGAENFSRIRESRERSVESGNGREVAKTNDTESHTESESLVSLPERMVKNNADIKEG